MKDIRKLNDGYKEPSIVKLNELLENLVMVVIILLACV